MTFTGICRFCGQTQTIEAKTQEDADKAAALKCNCEEGEKFRRQEKLHIKINGCAGENCKDFGFRPVNKEALELIHDIGDLVLYNEIQSVKFSIDNTIVTLSRNSKGNVKVSRSEKKNISAEC